MSHCQTQLLCLLCNNKLHMHVSVLTGHQAMYENYKKDDYKQHMYTLSVRSHILTIY
jgi:hypothetical protein